MKRALVALAVGTVLSGVVAIFLITHRGAKDEAPRLAATPTQPPAKID